MDAQFERHGLALSLGLLIMLTAATVSCPHGTVLVPYLTLPALLASGLVGTCRTAAVALLSTAAAVSRSDWTAQSHTAVVVSCALVPLVGLTATAVSALRSQRDRALREVETIANVAQRAVLRPMPPTVGDVRLAARYLSATSAALIGGDLYEVVDTEYGVRMIVGDVRGKGLDAVQTASTVLGAFRCAAFACSDLAAVIRQLDAAVSRSVGDEDFVTAVLLELGDDGTVLVVNCGHHPPLLLPADGSPAQPLEGTTTCPLGLASTPTAERFIWQVGDQLLLYTDGLIEARNRAGVFFTTEQAAAAVTGAVNDTSGEGADPLGDRLDAVVSALREHADRTLGDDLALVLARREAPTAAHRPALVARPSAA